MRAAVRAEPHQPAHRVGFAVQHRAVEIVRGDIVPLCRPERPFFHPNAGAIRRAAGKSSPVIAALGTAGNNTLPPR